jgi:hypothetical protein
MTRHSVALAGLLLGVLYLVACAGLAERTQDPFGSDAGAIEASRTTRAEVHRVLGRPEYTQAKPGVELYRRAVATPQGAVPVPGFRAHEAAYCAMVVYGGSDLVESMTTGRCEDISVRTADGEYSFREGILYAPRAASEEMLMRVPGEGGCALVLFPREWVGNACDVDGRRQFAYGRRGGYLRWELAPGGHELYCAGHDLRSERRAFDCPAGRTLYASLARRKEKKFFGPVYYAIEIRDTLPEKKARDRRLVLYTRETGDFTMRCTSDLDCPAGLACTTKYVSNVCR